MNKQQLHKGLEQEIIGYDNQGNFTTWRCDVETENGETGSVEIDNGTQRVGWRNGYWELDPDSQQQRERAYKHELDQVSKDVETEVNLNKILIIIWLILLITRTIVVEGWDNFWHWDWSWEILLDSLLIVFGLLAFISLLTSTVKDELTPIL